MPVSRRRFAKLTLFGAVGAATLGGGVAIINYLWPRVTDREDETVTIPNGDVPSPGGEPVLNEDYGFYLVNMSDENGAADGTGISPGLLALSTACPHISGECPVRWQTDHPFTSPFNGETVNGWMVCPCHGSVFTRAGVRVFGPSPRSLDAHRIEEKRGGVVVHLTELVQGGVDAGVEPLAWP